MQIKLFTIPVGDNGSALQEMNVFLRGKRVVGIDASKYPGIVFRIHFPESRRRHM
jgi:hypothetical protein